MSEKIEQIDARMLRLGRELSGLQGAVMREADPERYQAKVAALAEATRAYFRFYFDSSNVSMP